MANASVRLRAIDGILAPGKSGDKFADATARRNAPLGSLFKGTDGTVYMLVKMINASAPNDGDLCVPDKNASNLMQDWDDAASGDVGQAPVGVYVSSPAQNQFCFVAVKGPIQTKLDGSTDNIAVGDILILGAANDLTKKIIQTPTATSASREGVAFATVASTADESGLKTVVLLGHGV